MAKKCVQCEQDFEVFQDEVEFLKKMEFRFGERKYSFPESDRCPDCRNQIRTAHRNESKLYQRKSDLSGKQVISLYPQEASWGGSFTIYTQEEWNSDDWDPMDYGREFDFSRPFFEQFAELVQEVPRKNLITIANENSPFTTGTGYCRNCHLINSSEHCEDSYYGKLLQGCKDSVDCSYLYDSQLCYECFSVSNSYQCVYLLYSSNCNECYFSENLRGCKNCFLCTNLNNKEYYFMNEPLDPIEWKRRVDEFMGSYQNFKKARGLLMRLREACAHKYANTVNSESCTGDFIEDSKGCINCYDVTKSEDCRNVWVGVQAKDVYDGSNTYEKTELNYQMLGTIDTFHCAFTTYAFHSQNIMYSDQIYSSKDLFGCAGLTKKQYCVFNKQYSKEAYEELVPRIIEHMQVMPYEGTRSTRFTRSGSKIDSSQDSEPIFEWGQFFPVSMSPHYYNESLTNEYYPFSKEQVLERGWYWYEGEDGTSYQGPAFEIPDTIEVVSDDIVDKVLNCEVSEKPYKLIKQELAFYRKLRIPIPRRSPDQRHRDRMAMRNERRLWDRECSECGKGVESSYSLEREERVLCEECYLKEVY
jgi:hypothetical protein